MVATALGGWRAVSMAATGAGPSTLVVNGVSYTVIRALRPAAADAASLTVTGLANGTTVKFQVRAVNNLATGVFSDPSEPVTPAAAPGAPLIGTATRGNSSALGLRQRPTAGSRSTAMWSPPGG